MCRPHFAHTHVFWRRFWCTGFACVQQRMVYAASTVCSVRTYRTIASSSSTRLFLWPHGVRSSMCSPQTARSSHRLTIFSQTRDPLTVRISLGRLSSHISAHRTAVRWCCSVLQRNWVLRSALLENSTRKPRSFETAHGSLHCTETAVLFLTSSKLVRLRERGGILVNVEQQQHTHTD